MANTLEQTANRAVSISAMDGDFDFANDTGLGVSPIESIQFEANAQNDELYVRDGSITGPIIYHAKVNAAYEPRIKYFHGQRLNPCIDYSECAVADCAIHIILAG